MDEIPRFVAENRNATEQVLSAALKGKEKDEGWEVRFAADLSANVTEQVLLRALTR